jgi:hypothetical protein
MKKSTIITTIFFGIAVLMSSNVTAQKFPDLDKSPLDVAMYPSDFKEPVKTIKVVYSRPQLKGRTVSSLAPEGKVWRTGANEATEITFYKDVKLGDTKIKAGSYSLFTIPEKDSCTIIINKDLNAWGAYSYKEENDVARLKVPVTQGADSLEAFSMVFTKGDKGAVLNLGWDKVRVAVPFTE